MATWSEFAVRAPEIAEKGRRLLYRTGSGEALLATVRDGAPPRIHPIAIDLVDDGLYAFILPSPKLADLERDGRYALHTYPDATLPNEFELRGKVRKADDATRTKLAKRWSFKVGTAPAFEFLIGSALVGERASRREWPPRYSTWTDPTMDQPSR